MNYLALAAPVAIADILMSTTAIFVYIFVILAVIVVLILSLMFRENRAKTAEYHVVGLPAAEGGTAKGGGAEGSDELPERFNKLSAIDRNRAALRRPHYDKNLTLERFCDDLRSYAAHSEGLYYNISDIRRFVAGMAVSHILILQGMSGTGKTSLARVFGAFVDNISTIIPVQPMWKERTDLVGYYNEFTRRFNETLLLEKMYEAHYDDDIYITVLDEMNIARVEYYFAEFLSLLEIPKYEERMLDVVADVWPNDPEGLVGGRLNLPPNMWFIGTANNDDSTFAISDKVYDRAMIMNLDSKCEPFAAPRTPHTHISYKQFNELAAEARETYAMSRRNEQRLATLDAHLIKSFHITFGNRIMNQIRRYIPVYVACGGTELEALDDILSKKIIRKLEAQNPISLKNEADGLCHFINELFGEDKMPLCLSHIRRLANNA